MNKARRRAKEEEASEKLLDEVLNGKVKIGRVEKKKKKPQPNRKGGTEPVEEALEEMTEDYRRILVMLMPGILVKLSRISDPREPGKITHSLPLLFLFGILIFLSHCASRRAAKKEIAQKSLLDLAREFVPGIEDLPHADTLARALERIATEEIDRVYEGMLKEFVRSDAFKELPPPPGVITWR
jgi:hypothetical protein